MWSSTTVNWYCRTPNMCCSASLIDMYNLYINTWPLCNVKFVLVVQTSHCKWCHSFHLYPNTFWTHPRLCWWALPLCQENKSTRGVKWSRTMAYLVPGRRDRHIVVIYFGGTSASDPQTHRWPSEGQNKYSWVIICWENRDIMWPAVTSAHIYSLRRGRNVRDCSQ